MTACKARLWHVRFKSGNLPIATVSAAAAAGGAAGDFVNDVLARRHGVGQIKYSSSLTSAAWRPATVVKRPGSIRFFTPPVFRSLVRSLRVRRRPQVEPYKPPPSPKPFRLAAAAGKCILPISASTNIA